MNTTLINRKEIELPDVYNNIPKTKENKKDRIARSSYYRKEMMLPHLGMCMDNKFTIIRYPHHWQINGGISISELVTHGFETINSFKDKDPDFNKDAVTSKYYHTTAITKDGSLLVLSKSNYDKDVRTIEFYKRDAYLTTYSKQKFTITIKDTSHWDDGIALSPDGTLLVYPAKKIGVFQVARLVDSNKSIYKDECLIENPYPGTLSTIPHITADNKTIMLSHRAYNKAMMYTSMFTYISVGNWYLEKYSPLSESKPIESISDVDISSLTNTVYGVTLAQHKYVGYSVESVEPIIEIAKQQDDGWITHFYNTGIKVNRSNITKILSFESEDSDVVHFLLVDYRTYYHEHEVNLNFNLFRFKDNQLTHLKKSSIGDLNEYHTEVQKLLKVA